MSGGLCPNLHHSFHSFWPFRSSPRVNSRASSKGRQSRRLGTLISFTYPSQHSNAKTTSVELPNPSSAPLLHPALTPATHNMSLERSLGRVASMRELPRGGLPGNPYAAP